MKHVPNTLSTVRIFLSPIMLFTTNTFVLFSAILTVAGATDMLDGYFARKYHAESRLGLILEAIGDSLYYICACVAALIAAKYRMTRPVAIFIAIVLLIRLVNVILARYRFHVWDVMHLFSLKVIAVAIFPIILVAVYLQRMPDILVFSFLSVVALAFLEESILLFTVKEYDVNCKGLYFLYKERKQEKQVSDNT